MDNFDLRKYLAEGRLFKEEYDPYDDYDNMDFSKLNPGQKAAFDEWLVQYSPDYFENKAEFQDMIDEFAEVENANDLADFVHDEFAGDKYERLVFIRQLEKAYLDDDQPLDEGKLLKEQLMPKKISNKPFTIIYQTNDMSDYEDYDELLSDKEKDLATGDEGDKFAFDSNTPADEIEDYLMPETPEEGNKKLERYGLSKYWKY